MFIDLSNKFQDKQKSWNFIGKKIRENRNKKFWSGPPADYDFKKVELKMKTKTDKNRKTESHNADADQIKVNE